MRKLLILTFALLLLLSGCGGEAVETVPATVPAETVDPGLYVPESDAELQSGGAVYQYALPGNGYWGLDVLGDRLLLFSGEEKTTVEVLRGEKGIPGERVTLSADLRKGGFAVVNSGLAYFDPGLNRAVYLDGQLQEFHQVALPEDMQGLPAFSADGGEVFYCVGQEIRGLDTERGLSRLIKSHSCDRQTLLTQGFDGRMVLCQTVTEEGEECRYISTENGATLSADSGIDALATLENRYFVTRQDGTTLQHIYGTEGETPVLMNVAERTVEPALALGGAVGIEPSGEGVGLQFYDLTEGKKTAAVGIPGAALPVTLCADSRTGCIWVLDSANILYRWDVKASPVTDETVYAGTVYTKEAPDTEGLKALQSRVDSLNKQHTTAIRIWNDAVKVTGDCVLEAEYQTAAIGKNLDLLEAVMAKFPPDFLRKSVNTKLRICLVRSVDGKVQAQRFWDDGDAYILLPCGVDVEREFISAMGYVVDIHTLGNSPMLDDWSKLNPEGFVYGSANDPTLVTGENRAFADEASMVSVSEERAKLFYYAMTLEGAELFKSPVMQQKLLLMCRAIRDAWRLEKKTDTYLWEQYLTESIAYKK